jgi:glutaredoxin-like YruB-family protein
MKDIKIYSTPTCTYCKLAKEYLKAKGIAFSEVNVAEDEAQLNEMVKKSGQMGVPVIDVGGTILVGFNKNELEKALQ